MLNKVLKLFLFIQFSFCICVQSQDLKRDINAHDPVMIKMGNTYYLYATGRGIAVWSSKDLINWKSETSVFSEAPKWAVTAVPGFNGYIWAPDISLSKGIYYLYYSVSMFGKNNSAIGVATNTTLDPANPNYKWVDHGMVIQSIAGKTNWNAIDPNVVTTAEGTPYLAFGSFWEGLKLAKLSEDRLSVRGSVAAITTIASRADKTNAIEAPFIFKKGSFYYLFASIDFCCKGKESTYKMVVGRSKMIEGPYVDDMGKRLLDGGGKLVLQGNEDWYGVGHNAVATFDEQDYLIFHGYSAKQNGAPKLLMRTLKWQNGWPVTDAL